MVKETSNDVDFDIELDDEVLNNYEHEAEKKRSLKIYNTARRRLDTFREDREMERLLKGCSDVWD
ncbi:MAG: hypothetical protein OEY11_10750 [Gammaproteobacteria bacterium]|nr:hypothetical protein [Gammaproteobacteria bacterium]